MYADNFAIGPENGHLTVLGDLDREGVNMFTLTVQAENDMATGGTPDTVRNGLSSLLKNTHFSLMVRIGQINAMYVHILSHLSRLERRRKLLGKTPSV